MVSPFKVDDASRSNKNFNFRRILQPSLSVIAIIGFFITIISIWLQVKRPQLEAVVQIISSDKLTPFLEVPGIQSKFEYQGETIRELWKIRIRFVNDGDGTIIGSDSRKNIIGKGIELTFPPRTKIIPINDEEERITFPHHFSPMIDSDFNNMQKENYPRFLLSFDQWRQREAASYTLYISCDGNDVNAPIPRVNERCIIDGRVMIKDVQTQKPTKPMFVIDALPKPLSSATKAIGGLLCVIVAIGFFLAEVLTLVEFFRFNNWKREYFSSYEKFVDDLTASGKLDKDTATKAKNKPWLLSDEQWKGFQGIPFKGDEVLMESVFGAIVISLIFIIFIISMLLMTTTVIPLPTQ